MTGTSRAAAVEPDTERIDRIAAALREAKLDALLCALPSHVLLLTGYWPVMATAAALFTADGAIHLLLPEDEEEIAVRTSVAERSTFQPGSLSLITNAGKAISSPLIDLVRSLGLDHARIGVELRGSLHPVSYLSQFHYDSALRDILKGAFPRIALLLADDLLVRLKMIKTQREIDRLRRSCTIAKAAYEAGREVLQIGLQEPQVAEHFRSAFAAALPRSHPVRADAFFFCMSGANSASAYAAYARTRERTIDPGDLVMVHCNSNADGYWTDITRTYTCRLPDAKQKTMRVAILEARAAALARISAGTSAAEVDKAARDVLSGHGFAANFKHAVGHGVGFAAANHDAGPRLHPKSTDILETGMTFNIEPAIYIEGYGGMRHCDVVALTPQKTEVLTEFQSVGSDLEFPL